MRIGGKEIEVILGSVRVEWPTFANTYPLFPSMILVITLLAVPVGNMKQILCSYGLPKRAGWAHLASSGLPTLISHMEKKLNLVLNS